MAVGGTGGDDRLPGSGSGLSALRLPPLKLPVSDDGSCEKHENAFPNLIMSTRFVSVEVSNAEKRFLFYRQ